MDAPLTSLRLLVDAIDDDLVTGSAMRHDYLGPDLRQRAERADDDLFELSRLESGDIRWTLERVRLDELVYETIDAMRPHADGRVAVTGVCLQISAASMDRHGAVGLLDKRS